MVPQTREAAGRALVATTSATAATAKTLRSTRVRDVFNCRVKGSAVEFGKQGSVGAGSSSSLTDEIAKNAVRHGQAVVRSLKSLSVASFGYHCVAPTPL